MEAEPELQCVATRSRTKYEFSVADKRSRKRVKGVPNTGLYLVERPNKTTLK